MLADSVNAEKGSHTFEKYPSNNKRDGWGKQRSNLRKNSDFVELRLFCV